MPSKSIEPRRQPFKEGRKMQIMDESIHDPYQARAKFREPTVCTGCGAIFRDGRWQWGQPQAGADHVLCPACHRIQDRFPAGHVTITGAYAAKHREELLQIARHCEAREKAEHPLQRIIDVHAARDQVLITTTDIHLARGIGDALHHAHQGELDYHYEPGEYLLRVLWTR